MTMSSSRLVVANQIVSPALPPVHISIDHTFTYAGGPRFQLYGIAHAEQHLFVITDEQHTIRRLVWVQFEGFLPDNQRTYRYPVTQTVTLAGVEFIYDSSTVAIEPAIAERPNPILPVPGISSTRMASGNLERSGTNDFGLLFDRKIAMGLIIS